MGKSTTVYTDYERECMKNANDAYNNYKLGKTIRTEDHLSIVQDNNNNYYLISVPTKDLTTVNPLNVQPYESKITLWEKKDYLTTDLISDQYFSLNKNGDMVFDIDHRGFLNIIELCEVFTHDNKALIKNTNIPINNVNNAYNVDLPEQKTMIIEEKGQWNNEISLQLINGKIYPYEGNNDGDFSFFINTEEEKEFDLIDLTTIEPSIHTTNKITSFGYVNNKIKHILYGDYRLVTIK